MSQCHKPPMTGECFYNPFMVNMVVLGMVDSGFTDVFQLDKALFWQSLAPCPRFKYLIVKKQLGSKWGQNGLGLAGRGTLRHAAT